MQVSCLSARFANIPHFQCIRRQVSSRFVPKHEPANPEDVRKLENFLRDKRSVLVLTGAGISTESGKTQNTTNNFMTSFLFDVTSLFHHFAKKFH